VIECDYKTTWAGYTCNVVDLIRTSPNDVTVTEVKGNHATGKFSDFVQGIDVRSQLTPRLFLNLNKFLPNLEVILFEKGLTEIHKEELAQFPKLKSLYLSNNELQVIEPDLFINNLNLQLIFLDNCKIKSVAPKVFDGLKSLAHLGFENNPCYKGHVENDRKKAVELAENIYKNCGSTLATVVGYGSEYCVAQRDFDDFRTEMRGQFAELTKKMQKLMDDTLGYVKIAKESCDTD